MQQMLNLFVNGRPRTKGHLAGGRGASSRERLVDRPVTKNWLRRISNEVVLAISDEIEGSDTRKLRAGFPLAGPLHVVSDFYFLRSTNDNEEYPTNRQYGDGDTLTRCVWDALTIAKCITDDSLVVRWTGAKFFGEREGVQIGVWML